MSKINWLQSLRCSWFSRRSVRRSTRLRRLKRTGWPLNAVERLEDRTLLCWMPPSAMGDNYDVPYDTFDTQALGEDSVLANDFGMGTLTAELVNDVDHGALTLNSNGHFVYTPDEGYEGADSFTYKAFDGSCYSGEATVSLDVAKPFSAQTNLADRPTAAAQGMESFGLSLLTGGVEAAIAVAPGHALVYESTTDPRPVVAVESNYTGDSLDPVPDPIEAQLTVGGIVGESVYYSDVAGLFAGATFRISAQVDAASLPTGRYDYTMTVIGHYAGGVTATREFTGYTHVVNRNDSEFGDNWSLAELDRLYADTGGVLHVAGTGAAFWFTDNGDGTFTSPPGPLAASSLVQNGDGTYTLTTKHGFKSEFDAGGLLTGRVDPNGNTTTYAYTDADGDTVVDELSTITGPFGRTTTFNYTSGLLSSVDDHVGRTTTIGHDASGRLTTVTAPDPDDAGPLSAPVMSYAYDGTTSRLASITDPLGRVTQIDYDFAGRFDQATYPDTATTSLDPFQTRGLVDTSTGQGTQSNPAPLYFPGDPLLANSGGTLIDLMAHETYFAVDRFGYLTAYEDQLGQRTDVERNADGQMTKQTPPDPDGGGPLAAPVTSYTYDAAGNLTGVTLPDSSTQSFVYDATLNRPTSATDELGRTTTFTYDSVGNLLSVTDPLSNTTDYAYDANGLLTSITLPDPDGAGPLTRPVTSYSYDASGRLATITNPDSSTRQFAYDSADNLASVTDELGRVTSYDYDNLNRRTQTTLPDPDGAGPETAPVIQYAFNALGLLTSITDPLGNVTSYTYDNRNRLTQLTLPDPDGAGPQAAPVTQYEYDAASRRTSVTDPLGNKTTYAYDAAGRLTSITGPDPDGGGPEAAPYTSFLYDNLGRRTRATDPLSHQTEFEYDARSRLTQRTDPDPDGGGPLASPVTAWTYDAASQLASVTDPLGRVTAYAYDASGNLTSVTLPDPDGGGPQTSPVIGYAYDNLSRRTSTTDPLGNATAFEYDVTSRLTKQTDPDPDDAGPLASPVTTWAYDAAGQLTSLTDPLGRTTSYELDDLGRVTSVTLPDPDGAGPQAAPVYQTSYDSVGNVLTETDPLGNVTSYEYDNLYRLTQRTDPDPDGGGPLASPVTTWAYNAVGRLTSTTDPLGRTTSYQYDNLGRRTTTTLPDPDGAGPQTAPVYQSAYDAVGNVTSTTDPLGNVTSFEFDNLDRLTKETQPDPDDGGPLAAPETSFAYDAVGNRTSLTDPVGNVTTFTYDGLNRLTQETNALSDSLSWSYDAAGSVVSHTDRNGRKTEFDYDHLARRTEERWIDTDGVTVLETLSYAYDAASQLTSAGDSNSTYGYTYDALGRVTQVDTTGSAVLPSVQLDAAYDAAGNRTGLSATIDGIADFTNAYQYDNLGRVTQITQIDGDPLAGLVVSDKRIDLAYNDAGQFDSITRYADLAGTLLVATSTWTYDEAGRLSNLDHTQNATNLANYAWTYDANGRITQFVSPDGTSNYTYDDTGQLTAADHDYQTDESYTYDENGNRTNTGYTTGTNNQLLSDGTYDYQYDAEGNRIQKTEIATGDYVEYAWDHRNRLTAVRFKDSADVLQKQVEYDYDVFDRRIQKRVDTDGDGAFETAQEFVYDGEDVVLVFDASSSLTNRFLHGPAVDQVFASEDALGEILWGLPDNQATVRDVAEYDDGTDTTSVVNHRQFDSFGSLTSESDPTVKFMYSYTGRTWDPDAELYYYRKRWYDAPVGRFISEDPIGFHGGDTNLSRYVWNGVTNYVDPTGWWGVPNRAGWVEPPLNRHDHPAAFALVAAMNRRPVHAVEPPLNPFDHPEAFALVAAMNQIQPGGPLEVQGDWLDDTDAFFAGWADTLTMGIRGPDKTHWIDRNALLFQHFRRFVVGFVRGSKYMDSFRHIW